MMTWEKVLDGGACRKGVHETWQSLMPGNTAMQLIKSLSDMGEEFRPRLRDDVNKQ
jgi:hypothetical protein